ncbi:MAG: hypothetical protein H7Z75_11970 [Ferruginibacter sp.]|nr:hypothetical protein [Cytophagales bacterium]
MRVECAFGAHPHSRPRVGWAITVLLGGLLVSACSKVAEPLPNPLGYEYFPLEAGQFTIYDLTDVTYSLAQPPLTQRYQIKEVVRDTFTSLAGQASYRIERFARVQSGDAWELDSVWTALRTTTRAVKTENNVSFVKVVFPLREGLKWNGNALNGRREDGYQIKQLGKRFTLEGVSFDETLTVYQGLDTTASLVDQDKRIEVYARNIGLIYQERVLVNFCYNDEPPDACLGQGRIDYGTKRIQRIIGYGKE